MNRVLARHSNISQAWQDWTPQERADFIEAQRNSAHSITQAGLKDALNEALCISADASVSRTAVSNMHTDFNWVKEADVSNLIQDPTELANALENAPKFICPVTRAMMRGLPIYKSSTDDTSVGTASSRAQMAFSTPSSSSAQPPAKAARLSASHNSKLLRNSATLEPILYLFILHAHHLVYLAGRLLVCTNATINK